MELKYRKPLVEKYFNNFNLMGRKKGQDIAKIVKRRCNQLKASDNFSIYLCTGLGKPHSLDDNLKGCYGISITGNLRLVVRPDVENLEPDSLKKCDSVIIEGVVDYHGKKHEWIIP